MSNVYQFTREPRAVWWPVKISVPRDDGADEITIRIRYRLPKRSVLRSGELFKNEETAKYILDWDGVIDQTTGQPLPFTPANLELLRDDPFFESALALGLVAAARGAVEKN